MGEFLSNLDGASILKFLGELPPFGVYVFLAVSSVIENVFPPWPGDTVTVIGGVVISQKATGFLESMIALIIGNLIGAWLMYFLGAALLNRIRSFHAGMKGQGFIKRFLEDFTSEKSMRKARYLFYKWGSYYVLFSRFSAGVRFFVSIIAGISRMKLAVFSFFFTLGVIIWNTILLGGGYYLGKEWERIMQWLRVYNYAVFALLAAGAALFFYIKHRRKEREKKKSGTTSLPGNGA